MKKKLTPVVVHSILVILLYYLAPESHKNFSMLSYLCGFIVGVLWGVNYDWRLKANEL